ncbi:hypothetical protein SAMN05444161_3157 [Rhizobiales bacterium GAS191]|nr:hypothetical protein SAMN05444161_3157 [Rhizobiales bacterium GAS191]
MLGDEHPLVRFPTESDRSWNKRVKKRKEVEKGRFNFERAAASKPLGPTLRTADRMLYNRPVNKQAALTLHHEPIDPCKGPGDPTLGGRRSRHTRTGRST